LENHRSCRYDHVAAFEGRSLNASDEIGRYCGAHGVNAQAADASMPPVLKSRGRVMTLQFKTDSSVAADG